MILETEGVKVRETFGRVPAACYPGKFLNS